MRLAVVAVVVAAAAFAAGCGGGGGSSTTESSGQSATTPPPTVPSQTQQSQAGGSAEAGKQIFISNGCGGCHKLSAAGTTGGVGPDLDKTLAESAKQAGKPLAEFTHESIVDPGAFITKGYPANVMPNGFGDRLNKQQLDELVKFIDQSVQ